MEPKRNCTNINTNSLQSLITQICARSKSLLILWNFLKLGVAIFFEDATHRLSNILPMAFRTYCPWPLAHTPARNVCGRSKLWCWRHRCTVRGSTLGAVYTSLLSPTDFPRRTGLQKVLILHDFGRSGCRISLDMLWIPSFTCSADIRPEIRIECLPSNFLRSAVIESEILF